MESHTAKLDQEYLNQTPTKLSKKEKKKLKEAKKLKNKKLNDADKVRDFIPLNKKKINNSQKEHFINSTTLSISFSLLRTWTRAK